MTVSSLVIVSTTTSTAPRIHPTTTTTTSTRTNNGGGGTKPTMPHSTGRPAWHHLQWRRMTFLLFVVVLCWFQQHPLAFVVAVTPTHSVAAARSTRRRNSCLPPLSFQAHRTRPNLLGGSRCRSHLKQQLLLLVGQEPPWTRTRTTTTSLFLSSSSKMSELPVEPTGNATLTKMNNNKDNSNKDKPKDLGVDASNQTTIPDDNDQPRTASTRAASAAAANPPPPSPPPTTTTTGAFPRPKQFLRPNDTRSTRKSATTTVTPNTNPKPTPLENLHMVNHTPPSKLTRFVQHVWQTWKPRIPNLLTTLRMTVLLPLMLQAFYSRHAPWYAAALWWTLAAVTDGLDGWWARRFDCTSPWGAFLDPVADKITVCITLIVLTGYYGTILLALPTAIIVGREIAISALREWMASRSNQKNDSSDDNQDDQTKSVVAVSWQGKVKTAVTLVALSAWLLMAGANQHLTTSTTRTMAVGLSWLWNVVTSRFWYGLCVTLLYTATLLTVTSGASYFRAAAPYLMGGGGDSTTATNDNDSALPS